MQGTRPKKLMIMDVGILGKINTNKEVYLELLDYKVF